MNQKQINKIIYFDKETISNILQERDHGNLTRVSDVSTTSRVNRDASLGVDSQLKFDIPFKARLGFLLSGKIDASYVLDKSNITSISSTEISEFEKLKPFLCSINNVQILDIENSSTSFRVAGGYLKIIKGGVDGLDTNEFKAVMDSYDGYDTYAIDDNRYVRFNNSAFLSNYKRNDLLTTTMNLYCIPVGKFNKNCFDFLKAIGEMERLISSFEKPQSLADIYPSMQKDNHIVNHSTVDKNDAEFIQLYDVLYACITPEELDEE